MQETTNSSIGERVIASSLWMGSWRWTSRLIGFATTIILARILLPEDFGIVATATIVVSVFTILIDLGTDNYLVRLTDPDKEDYDTAWTLRLIVISLACFFVYFAAYPGATYFNDDRLISVIQFLALAGLMNGLTNIGLTIFRRELEFRKIALIGLSQRITASTVTIMLAFALKDYWAMVIGEAIFMLVGLLLSYVLHGYRPRLCLTRFRKQWKFCKWIVVRNVSTILQTQGDSFVVARFFGIETMGSYAMGMRIATLPTRQLLAPVMSPVYSGLAKKQHDDGEFVSGVLNVIGITFFLMVPSAALFAVLGESLITVILGEKWISVVPIVAPLMLSVMVVVLSSPVVTALTIKGEVRLLAALNWFSAISVVVILLAAAQWNNIEILVWARVGITCLLMVVYYFYLLRITGISVSALARSVSRPVVASLIMASSVLYLVMHIDSALSALFSGVLLGGIVYLTLSVLLLRLSGNPETGEAFLLQKFRRLIQRKFSR